MFGRTSNRKNPASFNLPAFAIFALIFSTIWLLHIFLLQLPYFWDEAGYYIPAARDLWLQHSLIPKSTVSSGHPPLVMVWLALWWKFSGFTPTVTRTAMLLVSAFGLLGLYKLAREVATSSVAIAATALTAIYPVWFAQSSLAHLDVAAAAFTFWALLYYLRGRRSFAVLFFGLAGLAKETAIVAPLALCAYELLAPVALRLAAKSRGVDAAGISALPFPNPGWFRSAALLASALPLFAWFVYHHANTGVFFGNPEFFRYNVSATANPLRIVLVLVQRLWHAFGYLNLFVLVAAAGMAMLFEPISDDGEERQRIAIPVQSIFALLIAVYVVMLSVVGGAVIARYMLPVVPLVILVAVSTLRRRLPWWHWACAAVGLTFVLALFVNPPYRISPEDNLTYADFIRLHQAAAKRIETTYPNARVLTAWPASDELTRPWLRYVTEPMQVERIENFSLPQLEFAAQAGSDYQLAYVFSTKLEPVHPMFGASMWRNLQERFFDYHQDMPPQVAANILGGRIVYQATRGGEWVALIQIERAENAKECVPESLQVSNLRPLPRRFSATSVF